MMNVLIVIFHWRRGLGIPKKEHNAVIKHFVIILEKYAKVSNS